MPQTKRALRGLIRSTTVVASTARDLAAALKVPFLGQTARLSLSIVEMINVSQIYTTAFVVAYSGV